MSMQFRKRPIVIEAVRWDGSNENEIQSFMGGYLKRVIGDMLFIGTLEGIMCAYVGDYIVKGVKGEFYSCKPDIFAETYEVATIDPESKPLEAFLHPIDAYKGLKAKYLVFKADTGERVDNCFILRPDKDPAAVAALRAYAAITDNKILAEDIYNWVGKGESLRPQGE